MPPSEKPAPERNASASRIGARLSHFRITAKLGEGGMGEVFRAEDSRLGREVAIKVLPAAFVADADRLARFEREARVLAALSHPNIAVIHDVGKEGGTHFLVMELARGETLADRIARGPLALDEALPIALQIAEALEAAHERGIVHRDLKPANVMVDAEGRVKVLDFGLARAFAHEPGSAAGVTELTHSPTLTGHGTRLGVLLGTAAYMSPEQARGHAAGPQSDIWAFGVLLWEMLTSRRLFAGDTVSDTLAAVLRQELDPSDLPEGTQRGVRRTLELCLQRDPRRRLRHVGDALLLLAGGEEPPASDAAPLTARRPCWLRWAAAALALATLALAALWWAERSASRRRLVISALAAPPGASLHLELGLSVSPDGRHVVFAASEADGQPRLWIRPLAAAVARPLPGTEGASYPFWSPDSQHIAFFAGGRLKRIPVSGGAAQSLCEAQDARGGSWSTTGEIVFAPYWRGGLEMIPAAGGPRRALTATDSDKGELSHRWPWFLPGGKGLLFLAQTAEAGTTGDRSTLEHLDLESGQRTPLVRANSSMAYSATGHLLYWRSGSLVAHPLDLAVPRTSGDYVPLAEEVIQTGNELAAFTISGEGTLVYGSSGAAATFQLVRVDHEGERLEEITGLGAYAQPAISPDGERLAYQLGQDVWIHDLVRGSASRFTFEEGKELRPVWSPDGEWLAYGSHPAANASVLYRKRSSGLGEPEELLRVDEAAGVAAWSRDGRHLIFDRFTPGNDFDLWKLDLETRRAELLVGTPYLDAEAAFSPDGRWMAYGSNETGRFEVYVRAAGVQGGRWQISRDGGEQARWAPDGRTLYFLSEEGSVMALDVEPGESFRTGKPVELFSTPVPIDEIGDFDLHPDGRSFIINWPVGGTEHRAVLVLEWPRLLEAGSRP